MPRMCAWSRVPGAVQQTPQINHPGYRVVTTLLGWSNYPPSVHPLSTRVGWLSVHPMTTLILLRGDPSGSAPCGSRRRQISRSEPAKGTIWGCLRMEPVRSRPNVMRAHDPNRCERCAPEDAASFRFPFCTFFRTARYSGQSAAIVPIRVEAIPVANSPFASCHPSLCYLAFRSHF